MSFGGVQESVKVFESEPKPLLFNLLMAKCLVERESGGGGASFAKSEKRAN
jgi:hypothetical protein